MYIELCMGKNFGQIDLHSPKALPVNDIGMHSIQTQCRLNPFNNGINRKQLVLVSHNSSMMG